MKVMCAARSRWRIENQTFQTLKRHSYKSEHNFGHGFQNLASVFSNLGMLAFLLDQVQEHCCGMFRQVLKKQELRLHLRNKMKDMFGTFLFPDWASFWRALRSTIMPIELESVLDD